MMLLATGLKQIRVNSDIAHFICVKGAAHQLDKSTNLIVSHRNEGPDWPIAFRTQCYSASINRRSTFLAATFGKFPLNYVIAIADDEPVCPRPISIKYNDCQRS